MIKDFQAEERFYKEPFYLSYSGLNKLLYSPRVFYNQYILGVKEEKLDSHLVEGKIVHCLILEEDQFDNQFIIGPNKVPEGNAKIILDHIWGIARHHGPDVELDNYQSEILEMMVQLNYHQKLNTDAQRLAKVLIEANTSYFRFLAQQSKKILISQDTYEKCKEMVEEVTSNESAIKSLYLDDNNNPEVFILNEHFLTCSHPDFQNFKLKGFLDRIIIDKSKKIIRICDFKTTAKPIDKFKDTIDYFRYNNQAAIYWHLVQKYIDGLVDKQEWTLEFHFVVIDLFKQVYVYPISASTMMHWTSLLMNDLIKFNFHYVNKKYDLPYELAKEQIIL